MKIGSGTPCRLILSIWAATHLAPGPLRGEGPTGIPEIEPAALESRLLDLANAERKKLGLAELSPLPELAELARRHSLDMAGRDTLSHREADVLARDLAWARAKGKPYPPIPSSLGEVNVLFVTAPRFEDLVERADVIGTPSCVEAGLGVGTVFEKNREFPRGVFRVTVVVE